MREVFHLVPVKILILLLNDFFTVLHKNFIKKIKSMSSRQVVKRN